MRPFELDRKDLIAVIVFLSGAGVLLVLGWRLFWFLTDDAYISFRYISNSILGHGYVWNPPPFRPVEGYTNFLWMVLLEFFWRAFNIAPPESSNYLSLVFTFFTLIVISACIMRMKLTDNLYRRRVYFLGIVLLGLVTNRTVLTWSSSGLETAMFNFFLMLWVYRCIFVSYDNRWWGFSVMSLAVCIYLIRPDGILIIISTLIILFWILGKDKPGFRSNRLIIATTPLLVVVVHLAWRKITYGEWLPNTYYAKYVGIWPKSGVRYLLSFILEYAVWFWIALFAYVLIIKTLKAKKGGSETGKNKKKNERKKISSPALNLRKPVTCIIAVTILLHAMYYTIMIGGDHFEYRVYSHLIYLIFISFIWVINKGKLKHATATILLTAFIICSLPIPWSHWAYTRNLNTRQETNKMHIELAAHWPGPFKWYAGLFDDLQFWLINRYVCVRHQEHKINYQYIESLFPSREEGLSLSTDGYPVFAFPAIGVVSWVLPHINIIDLHGLNDYVIARNPPVDSSERMMAHDRSAPRMYVQCFVPNVQLRAEKDIVILKRKIELTAEDIIECENNWAEKAKKY